MVYHAENIENVIKSLHTDKDKGLTTEEVVKSRKNHGENVLSKQKKKSFFSRVFNVLKEPMMIILIIGFIIAFGTGLGKFLKTGEPDFAESLGVLGAILLSVSITLIMESSSEKAFAVLNKIYDNLSVKVIRDGVITVINQSEIVVGDLILLESGDKIVADGRLITSEPLSTNESALTGESNAINKDGLVVLNASIPLAERKNCLYSGTYVSSGSGKMVVTAIGDGTEIGKIAKELKEKKGVGSPLEQKLAKLGKTISLVGAICAVVVFVISLIKLIVTGNLTFGGVQELFISCIILIIAAVPEGLPTIVAVSLALNMIKLAKENALIKKMVATETAGAVSVICSDKTGTLTKNKMSVVSVCSGEFCFGVKHGLTEPLIQNFICNSTAEIVKENGKKKSIGNGTECALLEFAINSGKVKDYDRYRKNYAILSRIPFNSENKFMQSEILFDGKTRVLMKGAAEKVLPVCNMTDLQRKRVIKDMESHQKKARRILCFAHNDGGGFVYDGYCVLMDEIRPEVFAAVESCKSAGVKIKMLTGDNYLTAFAIAKELKIAQTEREVVSARDIENLSVEELKKVLPKITVIARSTPGVKSRVVKALKEMGEVVAVTGDGINDAPAIRAADVGIAMGKTGSEITKEAADVILLDDGFDTIVKAISFGRNVYKNLQRFILFQLSVNLSALLFVVLSAITGLKTPFNTLQLLWINVIMDGPPALTLGLERGGADLMNNKPVRREDSIVSKNMLLRIAFNGVFVAVIMFLQYSFNILKVKIEEQASCVFTLFIMFQLFNAFNSRELGANSIFKRFNKNKIMLITFISVFALQVLIVQVLYKLFGVHPMGFLAWVKVTALSASIVVISEIFKCVYRIIIKKRKNPQINAFLKIKKVNKKSIGA